MTYNLFSLYYPIFTTWLTSYTLNRGDYVVAVSSLNMDPMVAQAAEYFLSGHPFKKALIINALVTISLY